MKLNRLQRRFFYGIVSLVLLQTLSVFCPQGFGASDVPGSYDVNINMTSKSDTLSMSFDGALLKDVLLVFSQQSGLNFIAAQEVENRKVTVYFEDVSPQDALDAIVSANGLTYSKKPGSDIYMVFPVNRTSAVETVTKVIHLKYMRLSTSPLDIGGQVTIDDLRKTSAPSSSSGSSDSSSSSSSSVSGGASTKGADTLVSKLLSPQGKLAVDVQTNTLIVTDTKEVIEAIEKVLEQVDVPPSQVILEVYVMEVAKSLASDIGIEWGGAEGSLGSFASGIRTTGFPFTEKIFTRQQGVKPNLYLGELNTTADITSTLPTPSQLEFGTIDASNFRATLHAIQSDSNTKILARPRVLTQNNEAAAIKVVTNEAIGVETTSTPSGGSTATTTGVADRADVGVTMRMTPQINSDDSVLLFLEPAVTTVAASSFFPTQFLDPTTRLVRTMARVKDNQTLVIGGLIQSQTSLAKRKVPILGSLPGVLGKAFRYDETDNTETELLIFVTPHIVRGATSLGERSATARGEDVAVRRMLDSFIDQEMDHLSADYNDIESTKKSFFTTEQTLIRDSEKRFSNALVDKQMTQALDSLSPQLVDTQISQTLDKLSNKKYRS